MDLLVSNAFLGIYAIFCIIFIIQFFAYNRKEYLYYGLYLLFVLIYYFLFTTDVFFIDEQRNHGIANLYKECISTLAIIAYSLFSITLLDLKKYAPKLYNYNIYFICLNLFGLILYPVLYILKLPNHLIYYYATLVFSPISIYLIFLALKLKVPYTNYILVGTLFTTIGGIISIILSITISPNAYLPGQIAMVVDIVLFLYATQKKVLDLQKENLSLRFQSLSKLQEERQRISLDLHDEIGGGLSTIHLLSELTKQGSGSPKNLDTISKNSKELVQKMNEIVWTLNIKNDSLKGLLGYIRQYMVQTLDEFEIAVSSSVTEDIPDLNIDGKNRREVFLVIKEIINNIIKHSKATKIILAMKFEEKYLIIEIADNGIGFDRGEVKTNSFGLEGIKKRMLNVNGTITWKNNNGTEVVLKVPLANISYKSAIV